MTREEAILWLKVINTKEFGWDEFALQESQREIRERCEQGVREAIDMAIEALSADAVPIVYCMDCAKSVPLDEHGALWKCKAHDRTTLRHSYCNNGEHKGGNDTTGESL